MGSSPRAHLAYGYHLGSMEDFKAAERTEYGSPDLPWSDEYLGPWGFAGEAKAQLRAAGLSSAVQVEVSGAEDSTGLVLIVDGTARSVEWDEAMVLDPDDMWFPDDRDAWDGALADALTALGITPTQDDPKWLVYPSYG